MPPRDLPGLYWDEDRQRYFPLSSAPSHGKGRPRVDRVPQSQQRVTSDADTRNPTFPLIRPQPHQLFSGLRSSPPSTSHKDRLTHFLRCSRFTLTGKGERLLMHSPWSGLAGSVTAFQLIDGMTCRTKTVHHNDRVWSFAGDSMGWFHSSLTNNQNQPTGLLTHGWQPEFNLSSEVSSISVSDSWCIATSFGPDCKILHFPLESTTEDIRVSRIDGHVACDIWTADLRGSRLALGAKNQLVCIDDIADRAAMQNLPTYSDVFAVAQENHIIYAGLRNGGLLRFDTRTWQSKGDALLGGLFTQPPNSITNLRLLRDSQLLVSNVDGKISTFDLRFSSIRTPLKVFTGNVNSYVIKAPIAVDPSEDFLLAAGQDNRIRLWSLRSGGPPLAPSTSDTPIEFDGHNLLQHRFEHPVRAMQVSEEAEGITLWVGSGSDVFKYSLGRDVLGG
ncbi:hypothetical protein M404DRAFT_965477 [Pisolithus tinctorius Marx 270]|uniref:WD40 repeat-like protein n=1 Tax=Pisolithus tinctorius Marx 270 TaxID=870435 RepID=A0A0C3NWK1_PISTI|nr:hypothetical protein M404DRAFT_965477 [Pisolithus tinctorius Marx 270]